MAPNAPASPPWWVLSAADAAGRLDVAPEVGLADADAAQRLAEHGPNELDEAPDTPWWRRVVAALSDRMVLVLIAAAVVALVVNRELKTPIVIILVVALNAVIGLIQEGRAGRALQSLRAVMTDTARVRRNGHLEHVSATELVPGDVVVVEAGDSVPADGRLLIAHQLEIDESALTGESTPAAKSDDALDDPELMVGDRSNVAFMHTSVTRGRGELVVTATGMSTEIGRIAGLLGRGGASLTPLQRQLHQLAGRLAALAGIVVLVVMAIGLARGRSFGEVFETAVALAVASIPEGLPAVTAVTLALGVQRMAQRNAIVRRLAAVETLGCTTVICTDKTGTLTLNRMTAREVVHGDHPYAINAEDDEVPPLPPHLGHVVDALALCSDAQLHDGHRVGDPTELALMSLAVDSGHDIDELRSHFPRIAEVPFESSTKYMVTLHDQRRDASSETTADTEPVATTRLLVVKGAFDVLVERCSRIDIGGAASPGATADIRDHLVSLHAHHDRLAAAGSRVLAVATRELPGRAETQLPEADQRGLESAVRDLTLLALVAIVDPPRPEVRDAIATAHAAGITVTMITGDHAATATSIGRELGLTGSVLTGTELDHLDDAALAERLDDVSMYARVAPEHKLRLVEALRARGEVVAMTGDGVNDAPALERADIGVAMGITGTDVTKQAAEMVLTDDNFTTIVRAVEQGRAIYDNIAHFVRFQLSTSLGFAMLFLLSAAFGVTAAAPFSAVAILWVNLIMDGPPAMALGVDPAEPDVMDRSPRPVDEAILTPARWWTVGQAAVVMALGTLAVLTWAPETVGSNGVTTATAMAFTTFVTFQLFNLLNARSDRRTVFSRRTLANRWLWLSVLAVASLHLVVMNVGPAQRLVDTTSITPVEWLVCVAVASSVLWAEELRKLVARRRGRHETPTDPAVGSIRASIS